MAQPNFTIVWMGPLYEISGYGSVSRNFVKQFVKIGANIRIIPIGRRDDSLIDQKTKNLLKDLLDTPIIGSVVLIFHGLPESVSSYRFYGVSKLVVMSIFETDSLPFNWKRILNRKRTDEVWVPSDFHIESYVNGGVKRSKLRKVPYGIFDDGEPFKGRCDPKRFRFLYISNLSPRTATSDLIEAFRQEFPYENDVELYLKISSGNGIAMNKFLEKLTTYKDNRIIIDSNRLNENEIKSLITSAGLYISLDRANGWGMPNMEAMRLGIPTATVNWSGSTEFSNVTNSYLVEPTGTSEFVQSQTNSFPFFRLYLNQKWADFDIQTVKEIMRSAKEDKSRREKIIEAAYRTVNEKFNLETICAGVLSSFSNQFCQMPGRQAKFKVSMISDINRSIRNMFLDLEYAFRGFLKHGKDNPYMIRLRNRHITHFLNIFKHETRSEIPETKN